MDMKEFVALLSKANKQTTGCKSSIENFDFCNSETNTIFPTGEYLSSIGHSSCCRLTSCKHCIFHCTGEEALETFLNKSFILDFWNCDNITRIIEQMICCGCCANCKFVANEDKRCKFRAARNKAISLHDDIKTRTKCYINYIANILKSTLN